MAECSECGKQEMTFKCRYCGKKYCSEHRLPENHSCDGLDEAKSKSASSSNEWFQKKDAKKETIRGRPKKPKKPGLIQDIASSLSSNATYGIIAITTIFFILQLTLDGFTSLLTMKPALTEGMIQSTNQALVDTYGQGSSQVAAYSLDFTIAQMPWGLLTTMLAHGGAFHLFANMVTLYFFGSALEQTIDAKEMLYFYVGTGLLASIGYVAFRNLLYFVSSGPMISGVPILTPAVGASGAVVAVFAAASVLYPDAEVLLYFVIPMKIGTAMKLFAAVEIVNLITKSAGFPLPLISNFASSAHLVGLAAGLYFGKKIRDRKSSLTRFQLMGY